MIQEQLVTAFDAGLIGSTPIRSVSQLATIRGETTDVQYGRRLRNNANPPGEAIDHDQLRQGRGDSAADRGITFDSTKWIQPVIGHLEVRRRSGFTEVHDRAACSGNCQARLRR